MSAFGHDMTLQLFEFSGNPPVERLFTDSLFCCCSRSILKVNDTCVMRSDLSSDLTQTGYVFMLFKMIAFILLLYAPGKP